MCVSTISARRLSVIICLLRGSKAELRCRLRVRTDEGTGVIARDSSVAAVRTIETKERREIRDRMRRKK